MNIINDIMAKLLMLIEILKHPFFFFSPWHLHEIGVEIQHETPGYKKQAVLLNG